MQLTINTPINFNLIPSPKSTIKCSFRLKGSQLNIKVHTAIHIYYKNPIKLSTDVIPSNVNTVTTSSADKTNSFILQIPDYPLEQRTTSYLTIYLQAPQSSKTKVEIEDVTIINPNDNIFIGVPPVKNLPVFNEIARRLGIRLNYLKSKFPALPNDTQNRIFYIRPWANDSFGLVSWHHIHQMRNLNPSFEIVDIDWGQIRTGWNEKRNIILHPILYPFATHTSLGKALSNFEIMALKNKSGGLDVADSDKISPVAACILNMFDLVMVPSTFSKNSYINSGVNPGIVQILPHGVSEEFLPDISSEQEQVQTISSQTANNELILLSKRKEIKVLFFVVHSEYRKGSDLVAEVMRRIQRKHNAVLVVKSNCDTNIVFPGVRAHSIRSWLNNNDLKLLYDTCDILLSPSRGGGFEINALEGISRGLPTLVPNGGCFTDLMQYYIPINVAKYVKPLPGNPIHIGVGPELDINDFEKKLEDVIINLDKYKQLFRNRSKEIREKYTWRNTAIILQQYLKEYNFIR